MIDPPALLDEDPEALACRGAALVRAGRHDEAEAHLRRSLTLRPESASTCVHLANLLTSMGRVQESIDTYRAALRLDPAASVARLGLALMLMAMGQQEEPERLLRQVIEDAPTAAEPHCVIGLLELERKQWAKAEAALRRALELDPRMADAHFGLATLLLQGLSTGEAGLHLDEAIRLEPTNGMFRAYEVIRALPAVPSSIDEADAAAGAFDRALRAHAAWRASCRATVTCDTIRLTPFLLAYRDGNHLALLSRFADEVGPPRTFTIAPPRQLRPKLRLGVVSDHFRRHSVWDVIAKGILSELDRSRFEVHLYHVGSVEDPQTAIAKSLCDRWVDTRQLAGSWPAAIADDRPDVLFYPEIGMDPGTYLIARERLAPVQAVGWGHPITSGLATMDLFLSGELLEPPQAQSHYRERLVRLPGTGACTSALALPDDPPQALLSKLAARAGPMILIPQMPFKFDPRFDALVARIVQAVGPCTVVIPSAPAWGAACDALVARLGRALRALGSDPEAVLELIPWLSQGQFNALLDAADVVLDCPWFSGYTTAWLAAHRGAPMVTMEGPFLRQRLAGGLHRKLGITNTVVDCADAYVQVAVAVALEGRGSSAGQARRQAIKAAAPSLDGDVRVVRAIERAFVQAFEERQAAWKS